MNWNESRGVVLTKDIPEKIRRWGFLFYRLKYRGLRFMEIFPPFKSI